MCWTVAVEERGHMSGTAADLSILNDLIQRRDEISAPCHFLSHDAADLFVLLVCRTSPSRIVIISEHI